MSTIIHHHTVDSILSYKFEHQIKLDSHVSDILAFLDSQIVAPVDIPEAISIKRVDKSFDRTNRGGKYRKQGGSRNSSSDDLNTMMEDWDAMRNFKTTTIVKAVGFEKELNNIRGLLNKLSDKNYETQKNVILEKVREIVDSDNDDDTTNTIKVANMMFDIASANRFMSEIYADLYVELVGECDAFGGLLDGFLVKYRETLNTISYIDPDQDYDKFCEYNKANELRRASAAFIMNLTKRDMISRREVMSVIVELQELTLRFIQEDARKNEVDEITENVFLLVTIGRTFLSSEPMWTETISPFLHDFSKRKAKDYKSLSSRCVFKYMDMIGK